MVGTVFSVTVPRLLAAVPQRTVVMPKVIGMTVPRAEAVLADAGLRLGMVTEVFSNYPRGVVMGQPKPGERLPINYEVDLHVSKGPRP